MDAIQDWLNPKKIIKPILVPTGVVNGRMLVQHSSEDDYAVSSELDEDEEEEQKYVNEYRNMEEQMYATNIKAHEEKSMLQVEEETDESANVNRVKEKVVEIFGKYSFNHFKNDFQLPIAEYRQQINDLLKSNAVLIIQGPTGCGKTTQVPQYILDNCREQNEYCNIVVTQPRRIAAISVARRVCEERGWALGSVCGYQVGLERNRTSETILSYVTTGVLLQALVRAKSLQNYTHIIIDEVHERSQEMDFVLLLIRKFLYTNSFTAKVILMSATFDADKFQNYFKNTKKGNNIMPPTLYLNEQSRFNTQLFYIDQLDTLNKIPDFSATEPKTFPALYEILLVLIRIFDRLEEKDGRTKGQVGSVLVFLPGIYEIEEAYKTLTNTPPESGEMNHWYILPLHSSITNDEQRKVFILPKPGYRKIILSTNIAESSITVPDISYVIDFCLTKTMVVNPHTKYESLQLQWATHVNCTQRAGRVGRVNDGRVYRFVSKKFYEEHLTKDVVPEMLRAPLERIVLSAKELNLNDPPKAILALAIDPPNLSNIQSTVWSLKEVGALALTCRGDSINCDGDLTFLGHIMASLPLSVHLTKLIFLGHMFSCLRDCIIMAAGCALSNIFSTPFQEKLSAYQNRLLWADGSCSDLIAYLNLYKVWDRKRISNAFNSENSEKTWAKHNYINLRSLREWSILVREITERCARLGIVESVGEKRVNMGATETAMFLKVCMAGAFYPNYFKKNTVIASTDEREAVRLLGGRDPYKTVYFTDMDKSQPGPLYARRIKELFRFSKGSLNVYFDCTYRVYVEFNLPTMCETVDVDGHPLVSSLPGQICKEVYLAVKRRQLRMRNEIRCLPSAESWQLAYQLGLCEKSDCGSYTLISKPLAVTNTTISVLPTMDIQFVKISVSSFLDCGHFWAHNVDNQTSCNLREMHKRLNSYELMTVKREDFNTTDLYACRYDDDMYYRCKIVSNTYYIHNKSDKIQVIFIDYGDMRLVDWNSIRAVPPDARDFPPQAMECILYGVQPSVILNPRALWTDQANSLFQKHIQDKEIYGKVYSVVKNIVHLELFKEPGQTSKSFNKWLIDKGFAQKAEESYLSKENHAKRESLQAYGSSSCFINDDTTLVEIPDVEPPHLAACSTSVVLKGPFSPLETKVCGIMENTAEKDICIDQCSVNSVLLNTDPQDAHDRLIVAVSMGESVSGKLLNLRHTTIMPNIQGLPMLMTLLFCPKMEPKPVEDGTRFGAILCGLGVNKYTNRPLYPEHDLELTLDTELKKELLFEINELRYWMNMTVRTIECMAQQVTPTVDIDSCQRELKTRLEDLFKVPREAIERTIVKHGNNWRKFLYNGEILEVTDKNLMQNDVWPMHWTMELKSTTKNGLEFSKNLEELKNFATSNLDVPDFTCALCNETMCTPSAAGLHMISAKHKSNVAGLEI